MYGLTYSHEIEYLPILKAEQPLILQAAGHSGGPRFSLWFLTPFPQPQPCFSVASALPQLLMVEKQLLSSLGMFCIRLQTILQWRMNLSNYTLLPFHDGGLFLRTKLACLMDPISSPLPVPLLATKDVLCLSCMLTFHLSQCWSPASYIHSFHMKGKFPPN